MSTMRTRINRTHLAAMLRLCCQCLLALTGLVWSGLPAHASAPALPIGVAEFPPFKYTGPDGKIVGSDTEIVEQVFARLGYTTDIRMQPWKRVQHGAQSGEFAAIYSFTKTPEREKFYYFSDPINTVRDVFYKKKDRALAWRTLEDLKDARVAASAGYAYAPVFKAAVEHKVFERVVEEYSAPPELRNLYALRSGHVDVFICEISVCQYYLKSYAPEFDDLDYIDRSIGEVRTFHVGFPKAWPGAQQLAADFNAKLARFVKEGRRKIIFSKYHIISDLK
jgi:polar amino acid transport system substrate-binding protein